MAEVKFTALDPISGAYRISAATATLCSAKTDTGATDYVDMAGYVSKAIVNVLNGATNTCAVKVQGSPDLTNWNDIAHTAVEGSSRDGVPKTTAETVSAAATSPVAFLALVPGEWPRYVRANITSGNANGVTITIYAER